MVLVNCIFFLKFNQYLNWIFVHRIIWQTKVFQMSFLFEIVYSVFIGAIRFTALTEKV